MPIYIIERNFAEQLDLSSEDATLLEQINADEGVSWLFSFLSADRHRSYCLAPSRTRSSPPPSARGPGRRRYRGQAGHRRLLPLKQPRARDPWITACRGSRGGVPRLRRQLRRGRRR